MTSFFVDIVSNASMNFFPENTLSKFTNKLPFPIKVEGEWEVAINEIFYPNKIDNGATQIAFAVVNPAEVKSFHKMFITEKWFDFYYDPDESINEFLEKLNKAIVKKIEKMKLEMDYEIVFSTAPKFSLNERGLIQLTCGAVSAKDEKNEIFYSYACILFKEDLQKRLGFDWGKFLDTAPFIDKENFHLFGSFPPKPISIEYPLILLYADIIREHPVGDTMAPVLR